MVRVTAHATLALPADLYWKARLQPQFFDIENQILKNESKIVLDQTTDAEGRLVTQRIAVKPDLSSIPDILLKLGPEGGIVFTDSIVFDYSDPTTPYSLSCKTDPGFMPDRCNVQSRVRCFPNPDGRTCRQEIILDITVNIWGVGGLVENAVASGIASGYGKLPEIVDMYKSLYGATASPVRGAKGRLRLQSPSSNGDDAVSVSSNGASDMFYDAYSDIESDMGYGSLADFVQSEPMSITLGSSDTERIVGGGDTMATRRSFFNPCRLSLCGCFPSLPMPTFFKRSGSSEPMLDMGSYHELPQDAL